MADYIHLECVINEVSGRKNRTLGDKLRQLADFLAKLITPLNKLKLRFLPDTVLVPCHGQAREQLASILLENGNAKGHYRYLVVRKLANRLKVTALTNIEYNFLESVKKGVVIEELEKRFGFHFVEENAPKFVSAGYCELSR